jgi:hypothetical protein
MATAPRLSAVMVNSFGQYLAGLARRSRARSAAQRVVSRHRPHTRCRSRSTSLWDEASAFSDKPACSRRLFSSSGEPRPRASARRSDVGRLSSWAISSTSRAVIRSNSRRRARNARKRARRFSNCGELLLSDRSTISAPLWPSLSRWRECRLDLRQEMQAAISRIELDRLREPVPGVQSAAVG